MNLTSKMQYKLIIVESPTKAKTLALFLGKDYEIDSTRGHIKDLPKSTLGVDVEKNFEPDYQEVPKKKDVIAGLRKIAKGASSVYIATDPDREGEAIAQHVYDILSTSKNKLKGEKIKRITFHEITQKAVEEAIAHPEKVNKNLVDAQIARRVLDRLVGYTLSPVLWRKVRRGLSAGRVQSVAVRLIVDRENEISVFKSVEYWEIFAEVKSKLAKKDKENNKIFVIQLIGMTDGKKIDLNNKSDADKILKDLKKASYSVSDVKKREVRKNPYPPFTTSTMTQAGARIFGWSAKRTMRTAQRLYEEGLITYHRTDSMNLSVDAVNSARGFIEKEYGKNYLPAKPIFYKTKSKSAQEAHEAIRVTDVSKKPQTVGDTPDARRLYELIWKRFLACQMTPAVYSETTIDVVASKYLLRASGQIMIFDGWRKLFAIDKDIVLLPEVEKGEDLDKEKVWGDQKFTQPPPRYNEASLIKTLEKLGIGRPSTYAPIISTIQLRAYVEKTEGKFFPTPIGIATTQFLVKNFAAEMEYGFTAEMEERLDKIATGKKDWRREMKTFWGPFSKKSEKVTKEGERVKIEAEKLNKKCPDCKDGELVIRTGRFGKFISCSTFPECKHTEKYLEKVGIICPDCGKGDIIVKKSGKGRKFFGCSNYPDCKFAAWKLPKKDVN